MGNDMDKKGILTVRMMGTISVEYEGEFFPIGTALTGKILQLFLILLYAGKKGVSYRITCNNGNQRPLINP